MASTVIVAVPSDDMEIEFPDTTAWLLNFMVALPTLPCNVAFSVSSAFTIDGAGISEKTKAVAIKKLILRFVSFFCLKNMDISPFFL